VSLYERYELLDLNRDDGVKTFDAREIATGRPLKVHLFVHPSAPLQIALLKAIEQLPDSERQRIVEKGKHEGTPYVVTDRLVDYAGLSEWVQAASHHSKSHPGKATKPPLETAGAWKVPPAPAPAAPAPAPAAPASQPSTPSSPAPPPAAASRPDASAVNQQFAELFPTAERPIVADSLLQAPQRPQSAAAPLRPPAPPQPPAAPPPQAKPEPGEFTRMFQAPTAPGPAPLSTPAPAPPQAPPLQAKKEAGEFTRMFQAPGASISPAAPAPPAPPPAASKSGPGDFTRFFETPSPAGPMPHSPAVQQPLTPQAPGSSGHNRVSEFTRTFGKGELDMPPARPPVAPPPQKEPGEFTRMFHSPGASAPVPVAPPTFATPPGAARPTPPAMGGATQGFSTPAPPPAAPKQSGPGEYTRQFSAPAQLTFGQTSATPSAPLAASPTPQAFAPPAMGQPAMPNMAQAPVAPKKSNLPLILGIVGIVVVAMLLVVFFVMRPKG
jgi:hypothetical protein